MVGLEKTGIQRNQITNNLVNDSSNPNIVEQPTSNGTYYLWVYFKDNAKIEDTYVLDHLNLIMKHLI